MVTEIQANRIYVLTDAEGRESVHVSGRREGAHGWGLAGGLRVLEDGRLVEGSVGGDGRFWVDAEYGTLANLTDVGARDDDAADDAAHTRVLRTNCRLDAPAGYQHTSCLADVHATRCPFDRDPHYGCDHQDGPCQVVGEGHIPCHRLGWEMSPAELSATMRRLGLSQVALSRLCGVDVSTVRRWQAGTNPSSAVPGYVETILHQHEQLRTLRAELERAGAAGR